MHREKMDCHFDIVIHFLYIYLLGKGSKKNQLWKIPYRVLTPPPGYGKFFFIFFLKLDHFLRTFCKKGIFTIENPKNDKTTFKQANFCLLRCQILLRHAQ